MTVQRNNALKRRLLNGFFMSLLMASVMSAVMTLVNTGPGPGFFLRWMRAFCIGFAAAYPTAFLCAPLAQRLTDRLLNADVAKQNESGTDKI
ncbi:MAG TPA: DUF2798 domain-containing protein [Anaerohalosphaeraceae bacterium]|nr:DUF2798 domain-containing protein [Anaerohalosphaeraceae bacterium]HOL87975.1 DUF2798 domain-containing protein [Anaerohalosphaeraceae bacterium]HPP55474.1 DUF2798 domain-containing protein [Anaerohalosphaeraceae bacterium]